MIGSSVSALRKLVTVSFESAIPLSMAEVTLLVRR